VTTLLSTPRWPAGLAAALAVAAVLTTAIVLYGAADATTPRVALTALGLIVLIGVLQPAQSVALILAALSAAGQLALALSDGLPFAPMTLVGAAATMVVGVIADELGKSLRRDRSERADLLRMIDGLRAVDADIGVTKWQHAELAFEREVARARRHELPLTLLRVVVDQWDIVRIRLGPQRSADVMVALGTHLLASSRIVDLVAYHGDAVFSLLLPDTPEAGAQVVARRITDFAAPHPGVQLRIGVAPLVGSLRQGDKPLDALRTQAELGVEVAERLRCPFVVCSDGPTAALAMAEAVLVS
jgi:GGDEF domain-containing protein